MTATANKTEWSQFLEGFPDAHLLQTAAWGELKSAFGWQVSRVIAGGAGAQILFRPVGLGLSLAYIPKGPVGAWPDIDSRTGQDFWTAVDAACLEVTWMWNAMPADAMRDRVSIQRGAKASA